MDGRFKLLWCVNWCDNLCGNCWLQLRLLRLWLYILVMFIVLCYIKCSSICIYRMTHLYVRIIKCQSDLWSHVLAVWGHRWKFYVWILFIFMWLQKFCYINHKVPLIYLVWFGLVCFEGRLAFSEGKKNAVAFGVVSCSFHKKS
jgi:hypothetical protein